jgi:hypothetical protein
MRKFERLTATPLFVEENTAIWRGAPADWIDDPSTSANIFIIDIGDKFWDVYCLSRPSSGGDMSAVATHVRFQTIAAASAIAAAAVLTPAAIAQAKPDLLPVTSLNDVFSTNLFGSDPILGPVQLSQDVPWWWLGNGPNPSAALAPFSTPTTIFEFSILSLVPGFLQPLAGWFVRLIPNIVVCVAGISLSVIGPYGTVSLKTGAC